MMRNSYWLPELFNDLMNAGTAVSRQAHTAPAPTYGKTTAATP